MAGDNALHIYSSRHYQTDEALYDNFTKRTGIEIRRVDGKGDSLIARLEQEGVDTPADLFITVDAGRLWRAEQSGLFQPVESDILDSKIPQDLRDPEGLWYGFSTRARVIAYDRDDVDASEIQGYADLADPKWKGRICIRSSGNIYNLSLAGSLIELKGEAFTKDWAKGLLDNLARKPQGGDTDQIKAIHAGACDLAVVNSYYHFRLARSEDALDQEIARKVGLIFPDAEHGGTHVNISGAGILGASDNAEAAVKFMEYLATEEAQRYFADGNNEFPVVDGVRPNDVAGEFIDFQPQDINVEAYGKNQAAAQRIFEEINFP